MWAQGVWEKDEIRKDDSFIAFEEVLMKATELDVDYVLLGGDLFHENKPSRTTLVKAIEIIKKHCLGDRAVGFQILSDQASNFVSGCVQLLTGGTGGCMPEATDFAKPASPACMHAGRGLLPGL